MTQHQQLEKKALTIGGSPFNEMRANPRMAIGLIKGQIRRDTILAPYVGMNVTDLSKGGIGIECRKQFVIGDRVKIKFGRKELRGKVVYGQQLLGQREIKMGIEFTNKLGISDMLFFGADSEIALK